MTTPDANSMAGILADDAGTVGSGFAPPSQGRAAAKTHRQPIGVSPAVLNAARKDGDALLRDVGTSLAGLSEAEAEERARASGPARSITGDRTQTSFDPYADHRSVAAAQEMDLNDSTGVTETTPRMGTVAHGAFEADPLACDCDPSSQADNGSA
jgi:hypothetical protein